jgi:FtsH-binding integral membrane protein
MAESGRNPCGDQSLALVEPEPDISDFGAGFFPSPQQEKTLAMSDFRNGYSTPAPAKADMAVDAGLRSFMLGVYNKLALGLVVAGALAYATGNVPAVQQLLFAVGPDGRVGMTVLGMIVQFLPLVLLFGSMFFMKNPTAGGVNMLYWAVVASIGAGMGILFLRYTGESLASTFFVTAAAFGALSLIGYTTKKDLTAMGSFLIMGVIGLIIASLVNMFMQSGTMALIISGLGVLIFSGLIAYDTQRLKMTYYQLGGDQAAMGVATGFGALSLFINFVNLFQFLLAFMGGNRN